MSRQTAIVKLTGEPIVKSKQFCPAPVVKYGIPDYADSRSNKRVIGTSAWREYWEEQIYRCVNGYITGGMFIPGRYYYYLNFYPISTVGRGFHHPEYVDLDYEFFMLVEYVKAEGYGIISVKGRRKGLSMKGSCILDYGMRFNESDYRAGICAAIEDYGITFYKKYKAAENVVPPEFRMNKITDAQEETMLGYPVREETGWIMSGSKNTLFVRTMHANANVFKGEQLDDCIFEEGGENSKLESAYGATRSCFMVGADMIGTPYIWGTADKMSKSGDFKKMWNEAESHRLIRFWISRRKIYAPAYQGYISPRTGVNAEDIPYIKAKYPHPHQRIGMQDEKRAEELFQEEMRLLLKGDSRKKFIEFVQNNPGNIAEAFQTIAENNYDIDLLTKVSLKIAGSEPKYKAYIFDWNVDAYGVPLQPRSVKIRFANTDPRKSNYDPPWKWILIVDGGLPDLRWSRLHVAGLDGYNQDKSDTSKSLGAMLVYRVQPKDGSLEGDIPVCIYYNRPPRKEMFFDISLKIAYAYNLLEDVNADAMSDLVIEYFRNNGGRRFLSKRPKEFASEHSEQQHEFGTKFVGPTREMGESLVQTDILDNAHKWSFPMMIQDCMGYNTNDGNDNDKDLHDALLLALIRKAVRKINPVNKTTQKKKIYGPNQARFDSDGDIQFGENEDLLDKNDPMDNLIKQMITPGGWSGDDSSV